MARAAQITTAIRAQIENGVVELRSMRAEIGRYVATYSKPERQDIREYADSPRSYRPRQHQH